MVTYGDPVVLGSVVVGTKPVVQDFFPLSIDYEEKWYAAGKISGSRFIKREGKPADEAVLVGRLIDRPIRPLFPKGYRHQVQVVTTVLSMDPNFRPDVVAMIAASSALMNAGVSSRLLHPYPLSARSPELSPRRTKVSSVSVPHRS